MTDLPIYSMPSDEGEILATPIRPRDGTDLKAMWEKLEEAYARRADYETCSSCGLLVPLDPRGDVVDSGGRCVECQS